MEAGARPNLNCKKNAQRPTLTRIRIRGKDLSEEKGISLNQEKKKREYSTKKRSRGKVHIRVSDNDLISDWWGMGDASGRRG